MLISPRVKLRYENSRGLSLTLAPFGDYRLLSCTEEARNEIVREPQMGMHGEIYAANSLESRFITIRGALASGSRGDMKRQLERVINPTLKGTLTYEKYSASVRLLSSYTIEVMPETVPVINLEDRQVTFNIDLIAFNPFWLGPEKSEALAFLNRLMEFPLSIEQGMFQFGTLEAQLESQFENVGDAEAGFRCLFTATGGEVINPSLINKNTGEYVKVGYDKKPFTLKKGDILEIIAYPQLKKITVNGMQNGFAWLETGSEFFTLPVGDNIIGYNADVNVQNLEVCVYYIPQYLGV